jgi:ribonuclease J
MRDAKGRVIMATFASLIARIQQAANAAQKHGRKLAIAGYSMTENVKMARRLGYLNIPDGLLVDLNKIDSIQPHKLLVMVTGSQGEPSSVLSKIAQGQHRQLEVMKGDTIVLSSHPIPGNEEGVSRVINKLFQRGANVIYDPILPVHVSGHCSQEEMRLLLNLVKPKFFVPVHGELRHLNHHARLAREAGIPDENILIVENGMVIELDKHHARVTERIPGGYVFVDGSGVGDVGRTVIKDRETLARDGFMMVIANVQEGTGRLLNDPEIVTRGFVYMRDAEELMDAIRRTTYETMESSKQLRNAQRRERLQEAINRLLFNETKRRPMIFAVVNEV